MIELKLTVTPEQLCAISAVLAGKYGEVVQPVRVETAVIPTSESAPTEETVAKAPSPVAEPEVANVPTPPAPPAIEQPAADVPPPPPAATPEMAKGLCGKLIPWDARIHGKSKNTNADGSWRLKQGIDRDEFVPEVEAELVAAMEAPAAPEAVEPKPSLFDQQAPAAPSTPTTFTELLPLVTAAKSTGKLSDEDLKGALDELGLPQFGMIATRTDLIPRFCELLELGA